MVAGATVTVLRDQFATTFERNHQLELSRTRSQDVRRAQF